MDKWFAITCMVFFVCVTAIWYKGCDTNHKEAMKCAEQSKTWNNNRCWSAEELKK